MFKKFSFNGQREGEEVVEVIKNHPFILFLPGLKAIFFLILGVASMLYLPGETSGVVLVVCLVIAVSIFLRAFYDYNQSVFILTSQRILNVKQKGFWKRSITEAERGKIQDVSSRTAGPFRMMLKFGDLIIRTAGTSQGEEIVVDNIPNPYDVQQKIANKK